MTEQVTKNRWKTILLAAAIAVAGLLAGFGASGASASGATVSGGGAQAKTVFMGVNLMGRRKGAAKKLNELHARMAAEGWHYSNMQAWVENGDLEGFFVTYTR